MRYTEGVYKRNRNGKLVYDGVLAYYDERGKRKFAHRERKTQSAAREALRKLRNELEDRGPKALEKNVVSFAQLADYCEKEIYIQAEYNSAGEKLFGVRNASAYKAHLKHFRDFFGARKLKDISIADLKRYRSHRLRSTRRGPNGTSV
jgi:vacuolar-type H+-ATPase subunit E/Vma4